MSPLTIEQVTELINKADAPLGYKPPQQSGPLRWYDKGSRCKSRGCGSHTFCKVEGKYLCMTHALQRLNEIAIELETKLNGKPSTE